MTIYRWVARGLFEKHKQIFRCQLTFRLMQKRIMAVEYSERDMYFLLNCPSRAVIPNSLNEWLPDLTRVSMQKLIEIEGSLFLTSLPLTLGIFDEFRTVMDELAPSVIAQLGLHENQVPRVYLRPRQT